MYQTGISRRGLIDGAGLLGAGILASSAFSSVAYAAEDASPADMSAEKVVDFSGDWDQEADIVVCGLGFGGLVAAATAAQGGASVIGVEAAKHVGGTGLAASLGFGFYTYEDFDQVAAANPTINRDLAKAMFDEWDEMKEWLTETGVPFSTSDALPQYLLFEPFTREGNAAFASALKQSFDDNGGQTMLSTKAVKLHVTEDGAVVGVRVIDSDGKQIDIHSKAVILANGGFIRNRGMQRMFLGTDLIQPEALPYNDGTGILMGLGAGAMLSGDLDNFSGYFAPYPSLLPKTVDEWDECMSDPEKMQANVTDVYDGFNYYLYGVLVNTDGKRYCDETSGDSNIQKGTASQRYGIGYLIIDQAIRDANVGTMAGYDVDDLDMLKQRGAAVLEADTLEELAAMLADTSSVNTAAWDRNHTEVNAAKFLKTIEEYNEAVDAGTLAELDVAHIGDGTRIENAPFYAITVTAGAYTTDGGLLIDTSAEVLGAGQLPIPGLYATFNVAGGLMGKTNWTVLPAHITYGRIAAKSALNAIAG